MIVALLCNMLQYSTMNIKHITKYPVIKKAILEFGPIVIFVVLFEIHGFFLATFGMIIAVLISIMYLYMTEKVLPLFTMFVSIITLAFAMATILFHAPKILIFRDTFYDFFFATLIFIGLYNKKYFLKKLFNHVVQLTDRGWKIASYSWGIYFICTGTINEIIRIHGNARIWIDFKIAVIVATSALGGILALYLRDERTNKKNL